MPLALFTASRQLYSGYKVDLLRGVSERVRGVGGRSVTVGNPTRLQLNRRGYRATVAVPCSPHTHPHTHARGVKFNAFVPCMLFGCALWD